MQNIKELMRQIEVVGGAVFLIGGFVRDKILGLENKDVDLEIFNLSSSDIRAVASRFGTLTDSIVDGCGIIKLTMFDGTNVDLCIPRRERSVGDGDNQFVFESDPTLTPEEARSRVDFTMNALLMDRHDSIIDPFGGIKDINDRVIRHVGPAFVESPVRVLRAMQFSSRFNMSVCDSTVILSSTMSPANVAQERIFEEFNKMFMRGVVPSLGLDFLRACGWITHFSILNDLISCEQDPIHHPEKTVWNHTLQVVDRMHDICVRDNIVGDRRLILMWSALLHDIGKPATTIIEDGRIKSPGHAEIGADMARDFLVNLRCPNSIVDRVVILTKEHMSLLDVPATNTRAIRRFVRRLDVVSIEDWARLVEADASGRFPKERSAPGDKFVATARTLNIQDKPKMPILFGRHLISVGFKPSPFFGTILKAAEQAEDNEEFHDVDSGIQWVKNNFPV